MPITVRLATPADARAIAVIHVDAWRIAYKGSMPDDYLASLSVDQRTEAWARPPRSPEHRTWVAEDGGEIVAFVLTGPCRDPDPNPAAAEVYAIYAAPAKWGTGAGRALIDHVKTDLFARGAAEIVLWVIDRNERARRFYEIAGFRADGADKHQAFGGADVRELRYRLSR